MRKQFTFLMLCKIIIALIAGYFMVALPLYLRDIGIQVGEIGQLFGVSMLIYAFLIFYIGAESDRKGRIKPGLLTIAGIALASLMIGILPWLPLVIGFVIFVAARILFSLSESTLRNLTKIRILDLAKEEKLGKMFGIYSIAVGAGSGIGLLAGALLLAKINMQMIFFIIPFLVLIAGIFYAYAGDTQTREKRTRIFSFSNLTSTSRLFKIVLLFNTMILFGGFVVDWFGLPLYQKEVLNLDTHLIFLVLGIAWTISGVIGYWGGKLYDRFRYKLLLTSLLLIAITSVILAHTRNLWAFSAILVFDFFLFGLQDPARFALAGKFSMKKKGMLMSFFELFAVITGGVVLLFFGLLLEIFDFQFIFYLRAIVQIAGIFVILYLNKLEKAPV